MLIIDFVGFTSMGVSHRFTLMSCIKNKLNLYPTSLYEKMENTLKYPYATSSSHYLRNSYLASTKLFWKMIKRCASISKHEIKEQSERKQWIQSAMFPP